VFLALASVRLNHGFAKTERLFTFRSNTQVPLDAINPSDSEQAVFSLFSSLATARRYFHVRYSPQWDKRIK
jgi:hypothetical protein